MAKTDNVCGHAENLAHHELESIYYYYYCYYADNLYEEVEPVAVLDARLSDGGREFLVKFPDAEEDSWVSLSSVSSI